MSESELQLQSSWFNYKTGEYDHHSGLPENMKDYIPQSDAAQNMFDLLVNDMGKGKGEAAIQVLTAGIPKED